MNQLFLPSSSLYLNTTKNFDVTILNGCHQSNSVVKWNVLRIQIWATLFQNVYLILWWCVVNKCVWESLKRCSIWGGGECFIKYLGSVVCLIQFNFRETSKHGICPQRRRGGLLQYILVTKGFKSVMYVIKSVVARTKLIRECKM